MTERDRIVRSVVCTLLVFGLLLLLVGGCQAISERRDDGCGWFGLAAAQGTTAPRPAAPVKPAAPAPAVTRKAPSLDKPKAPSAPAADHAPVVPAPAPSKTKKPRVDVDLDVDVCD